jgi:hypothetical protein
MRSTVWASQAVRSANVTFAAAGDSKVECEDFNHGHPEHQYRERYRI